MANTTKSRSRRNAVRPEKPYPDFPLMPHASGRWAKKIRQKLHYFGRWGHKQGGAIVPVADIEASARAALNEFNRQWPYLSEGRTPPPADSPVGGCTIRDVCNAFWRSKRAKLIGGELSPRTYRQYEETTDLLVAHFGRERRVDDLRPEDFEPLRSALAEKYGTHGLKSSINSVRMVFKYALDNGLIEKPVLYGQSFNRPSAKALRKARNEAGLRMFEAFELRMILNALDGRPTPVEGEAEPVMRPADPVLKAMVLLGVNCGFGNTDVARLPQSAVDLDGGCINFPRPKTEIARRVPLWGETVDALRRAIAVRPGPAGREYRDLCFLTRTGMPFVRVQPQEKDPERVTPIDVLSQKFSKLLKRLRINGRRGLNFYALRHVFETIGGESRDQVAVNSIMGHVDSSMAGQYRERISDERLRRVTEHVRQWLFDEADAQSAEVNGLRVVG